MDTNADTNEKGTQFWNKNANESQFDQKYSGNSKEERDLAPEGFKTKQEAPLQKQLKKIKWNKKKEENLCRLYKQDFVATFHCEKKAVSKQEEKRCKSYNIQAFWQRNCDRGLISTNIYFEPSEASYPSSYPLNKVFPDCEIFQSK